MINYPIEITRIYSVGRYVNEPNISHLEFSSNFNNSQSPTKMEIIYRVKGKAIVNFDGKVRTEEEGCVRILPPGICSADSTYTIDRLSEESDCIDIFFQAQIPFVNEMIILKFKNDKSMKVLFEQILMLWTKKECGYNSECMARLYQIIALIEKKSFIPLNTHKMIQPAVEYIETNYSCEEIDCEKLVSMCGISGVYFRKLFHLRFGMSPQKYINEKRVRLACELIETKRFSLSEIAQKTGFTSLHYFSRTFKSILGIPPSRYLDSVDKLTYPSSINADVPLKIDETDI